jgi:hypothetical protein
MLLCFGFFVCVCVRARVPQCAVTSLEVIVVCSYCHMLFKAQRILLVYFGMVLYEGKRVVGIIVTTLKFHRYDAM